jgi:uncharacterized membrane protein YkoI
MKKWFPALVALMTVLPVFADNDSGKREKLCKVTRQEAQAIATKKVPGLVTDCDIEKTRKGRLYWSIDITPTSGAKQEVRVDGQTGEIISVETDD